VDLVLMFRDPDEKYALEPEINELLRNCDRNSIPVATNVATAEVLIQGLARGDFGWRDVIRRR
jgi:methylglyoxal synthase